MIRIDFEIIKDDMTFRDAIVLPTDHGFSNADIESMKQKRFDEWHKIVTTPAEEVSQNEIVSE